MNYRQSPQSLTVHEMFDGRRYRVPIYQRAYAWTSAEVSTLLADIRQARLLNDDSQTPKDYFLGSLVVDSAQEEGDMVDEVVDGQQRLTTLAILLAVAGESVNMAAVVPGARDGLRFEGRPDAERDIGLLQRYGVAAIDRLTVSAIRNAAALIGQAIQLGQAPSTSAPSDGAAEDAPVLDPNDLRYLLHHVRILRTQLPPSTDLNHYFEVMNTRGEQLAKHEILKARLMSPMPAHERKTFARVWDACSVLDRHVQLQFDTTERTRVFGDKWDTYLPNDFTSLHHALKPERSTPSAVSERRLVLTDVLADKTGPEGAVPGPLIQEDDDTGAYGAIVDFPNFLLHVLRVKTILDAGTQQVQRWGDVGDETGQVRLEDKFLLEEFERFRPRGHLGHTETAEERADFSRRFLHLLLQLRHMMDNCVIRAFSTYAAGDDDENWVLETAYRYESSDDRRKVQLSKRMSYTDHGEAIRAIQAMFQVTDTRRASKYFLFRILLWTTSGHDDGNAFLQMLEDLAAERLRRYDLDADFSLGTHVPNYLFNVLDYILWSEARGTAGARRQPRGQRFHILASLADDEYEALAQGSDAFRFRYRTSVEHFYPVHPSGEQGHRVLEPKAVDRFGNLCIMSRSENSRRNNLMPTAKVKEFKHNEQSLKFQLMAAVTQNRMKTEPDGQAWAETQIKAHEDRMKEVLTAWLQNHPAR